MTAFSSSTRTGAPLGGKFATNDTFTDSVGNTFECIRGGYPGTWQMSGITHIQNQTAVNVGAVSGTGVTAVEYGAGSIHQTVFTITATPLTILNAVAGTQASGVKIYTYPEGRIALLGVTASIAETTTSTIASTLHSGITAKFALGTTIGTNASLATTEVDHCPATSITTSATINVAGATATAALAAGAQFDGTATAKAIFLNFAVPTDADLAADATITLSGTVTVSWILLGDY